LAAVAFGGVVRCPNSDFRVCGPSEHLFSIETMIRRLNLALQLELSKWLPAEPTAQSEAIFSHSTNYRSLIFLARPHRRSLALVDQTPADGSCDRGNAILGLEFSKNPQHLILDGLFRRPAAGSDVTIVLSICDGLEDFQFLRRHVWIMPQPGRAEKPREKTSVARKGKKKGARERAVWFALPVGYAAAVAGASSSRSMERICSRSSGVSWCPCTVLACRTASSRTSSSVPEITIEQGFSAGKRRQSITLRFSAIIPPLGTPGL
jgi:hypothetical protein